MTRRSKMQRRDFVKAGALGVLGLDLAAQLRLEAAGAATPTKAKSAIVVWLGGGPPHMDTFDLKPDAPAEVRGEFNPIDTNVAGIRICEHLPRLARQADKLAILRGVSHTQGAHELGTAYLSSGNRPVPSLVYPGYGAVVSRELPGDSQLPHFVALPNTPQRAGYLGVRSAPLQTNATPRPGEQFSVRGISLADGLTVADFEKRSALLEELDTAFRGLEQDTKLLEGLDEFGRQAYDMLRSPRAREAFDVSREPTATVERFGKHGFGMNCLLAARLIEAGVRFATVSFSGWDTHGGNFKKCKESLLPQLDDGVSGLLETLAERGLLESTVVYVVGEFGRTPKINEQAGRDHWPRAMSVLFAGGGVRGGQVIGQTDEKGMGPNGEPTAPEQLAASFYQAMGIDCRKEYHTSTGRPVMIVREGTVIEKLFA